MAFMIAPQQEDVLWVHQFVQEQQCDGQNRMASSIDIVTQKQVSLCWWVSVSVEYLQQI